MNDFLQYVEMDSFLHKLDPRTKFIFFLAIAVLTSFIKNGLSLLLILVFFLVIWIAGHITKYMGIVLKKLKFLLLFVFLLWLILGMFQDNESIVIWKTSFTFLNNDANICLEWFDIYKGAVLALRIYLMIASFYTIIISTNFSEIILGLQKFRMPYKISFGIGLVFQIIPMIIQEFYAIMEAQSSRGLEVEKCGAVDKVKNYVTVSIPLLFRALGKGHAISLAMYYYKLDFKIKRTSYKKVKSTYKDIVFLAITAVIVAGALYLNFAYYYKI